MSLNSVENGVNGSERTVDCTAPPLPQKLDNEVIVKKKSFFGSLPQRIPAFGLLCCILGETMFSLASLIVKTLKGLHPVEILVWRCVFQLIPFIIIAVIKRYPIFGIPGHRLDIGLRSIVGTTSLICLYMAYRLMPLSDSSSIFNASPILTIIFAYFVLKEPITIIQGFTGLLAVLGVFIISKPGFIFGHDEIDDIYDQRILGIILAVVACICTAAILIVLRRLKTTPVSVIVIWYSLTCIVSGSVVLAVLDEWVVPIDAYTWLMLLAIGLASILQQIFLTTACKYEHPGPISVTRSVSIVLAFIWEVTIFSEPVEWTSIVGAVLVVSCVVIIALVKWHKDNPDSFNEFFSKIFCYKRGISDYSSQTSIESIEKNLTDSTPIP